MTERRIRVLSNPGTWRDGDNPFLRLLFEAMDPSVEIIPFSWRRAIVGRYDVLHIHWLERVVRSRRPIARLTKQLLFLALSARLSISRTPALWTVHNEHPHETGGPFDGFLFGLWRRIATHKVLLSRTSTLWGSPRTTVIPHGHYRPVLQHLHAPRAPERTVRFLAFGHLRPYKGFEHLIELFGSADVAELGTASLDIVGMAANPDYGRLLIERAAGVPSVRVRPRFLSDAELEVEIAQADLIVLPYARMMNSGAALLALSCDRPILVPASASMVELQDEVGAEWVQTFEPPLSLERIALAAQRLREHSPSVSPDLHLRDWSGIAAAYTSIYRSLSGLAPVTRP